MKVIAITEENLEELLAYDDLFLDYFNAFLALPVFAQAVAYNRLTGTFEEVSNFDPDAGDSDADNIYPPYGATDAEHDGMLQWAKDHRLIHFLKTELFREFKLCKLLLRPLDDHHSACSRSAQMLRGYSRQTESYISSLSYSIDRPTHDITDDTCYFNWSEESQPKTEYSTSRAKSVPTGEQYKLYMKEFLHMYGLETTDASEPPSLVKSLTTGVIASKSEKSSVTQKKSAVTRFSENVETIPDSDFLCERQNNNVSKPENMNVSFKIKQETEFNDYRANNIKHQDIQNVATPYMAESFHESFYARGVSAPSNYDEYLRAAAYRDFDAMFGEAEPVDDGTKYVVFDDDPGSETQTDADLKSMEGHHRMTFQQLKELILSSSAGMECFIEFLTNTAGADVLNFWLDCENYKDMMEDCDDITNMEMRNRLYRDIQDKYRMTLNDEAKQQISKSASRPNVNLSHTIFIRAQYDVLRRLRTYWLPRFLIHLEHTDHIMFPPDVTDTMRIPYLNVRPSSIFPSLSLAKSLPTNPDNVLQLTKYKSWESVCRGDADIKVRSAKHQSRLHIRTSSQPLKERLLIALSADKDAGGPFLLFLERYSDRRLVHHLNFWQAAIDYGIAEDRSADRLLRLGQAMSIYSLYISLDSPSSLGLGEMDVVTISGQLSESHDFIDASIFNSARLHVIRNLQDPWIRFLKEDLKAFLDCQVVHVGLGSVPSTAGVIDISVTNENQLIITKPQPWLKRQASTSPSERGRRLRRALSIADSIERQRLLHHKHHSQGLRKEMEKERRKAVRAAKQRQKEAKLGVTTETVNLQAELDTHKNLFYLTPSVDENKKPLQFCQIYNHKQMLQIFKRYLNSNNLRNELNMSLLYHDIVTYNNLSSVKDSKVKKDAQAIYIYKTYLDSNSRKNTIFSNKIHKRVNQDKERPKSATLREIQTVVVQNMEDAFTNFLEHEAEVLGVELSDLQTLSLSDLIIKLGSDDLLAVMKPSRSSKKTARSQPMKDDKVDLMFALNQSATGKMQLKMFYFYKYLCQHGEEENVPLIHKDLIFYIEVLKFKEYSHLHTDGDLLKKKVQSINECFLDSQTPPQLQITIPSDVHVRAVKAVQKYVAGKEITSNLFDEAMFTVFKELLPFWSGFQRSYVTPKSNEIPQTKIQKMLKKRMEAIEQYEIPKPVVSLPKITQTNYAAVALNFSLNDGLKVKEIPMVVDRAVSRAATRLNNQTLKKQPKRKDSIVHRKNLVVGKN